MILLFSINWAAFLAIDDFKISFLFAVLSQNFLFKIFCGTCAPPWFIIIRPFSSRIWKSLLIVTLEVFRNLANSSVLANLFSSKYFNIVSCLFKIKVFVLASVDNEVHL